MPTGRPQQGQGTGPRHGFFCLAYSPSGALIAGGTVNGTLHIWDASSGNLLLGPIRGHKEECIITHVRFVTEDVILSSAHDATVRQWDARTGEPIGEAFTAHEGAVCRVTSLPDKKTAASITKNGELLLWRLDTLEVIREAHVVVDAYLTLAFSPDGTRLVSVHFHMLHLYDVENCRLISEVNLKPRMPPMLLTAAFSPNASKVFFGSGSDSVVVWDVGKEDFEDEVLVLDYEEIPIETMCSPDGTLVANSSDNGKTHVWSTITREVVKVLDDSGPFAFSSDSRYLTYVLPDTKLSINLLRNAGESRSIDSSSIMDQPATERPTDSQQDGNDPTHVGRDLESEFFASRRPCSRREDSPAPQNPDSQQRERRRISWPFKKRNKRSQNVQAEERRSPEPACPARDKRPLVVAPHEISRKTRQQQNRETALRRRTPSQAETSSAESEGRRTDDDGSLGFSCFAALRSKFPGSITRGNAHPNTT